MLRSGHPRILAGEDGQSRACEPILISPRRFSSSKPERWRCGSQMYDSGVKRRYYRGLAAVPEDPITM
jgi:hypothetical protein